MDDDSDSVTTIRNLGPSTAAAFARVGITSASDLRRIGADQAYARLLRGGDRPHFIAYYALVLGLQGRPWNDARGDEKTALRARFDALKAAVATEAATGTSALDRALAEIGVLRRR